MDQETKQKAAGKDRWTILTLVPGLVFVYALLVNAWIVDDAYITFRTVDNFVNGYGLTWNVGERVQVYTHPLWMFVVSLLYLLTSELFYSVILLSFILTLAAAWTVSAATTEGFRATRWKPALLIVALLSSKAFVDFASSGLENPLSYLIAALFCARLLSLRRQGPICPPPGQPCRERQILELFLIASAAFFNRSDTVLLYLPALVYLLISTRSLPRWRLVRASVLGTLPATLWLLFSLLYYGFIFPNTAYAKMLSTGFPDSWKLFVGTEYLATSAAWDTASFAIMAAAVWCVIRQRSIEGVALVIGILLYVTYVVTTAASATHMSGRFFAVPFFVSAILFVEWATRRWALVAAGALIVYMVWSPVSSIKFGTSFYRPHPHLRFLDTKWLAKEQGAALINWRRGKSLPDHPWFHNGRQLRQRPEKVHVGGAFGGEPVGYFGFAAGPEKHIVDVLALTDPLLARLPALQPTNLREWRPGHFRRALPDGYLASIASGKNQITDPSIARTYDLVVTVTRGRLLRADRLRAIWAMNLGNDPNAGSPGSDHPTPPR